MFGIGFGELLILGVILLVLIGPQQLPDVMKWLAKAVKEITQARRDIQTAIDQDDSLRSLKDSVTDVQKSVEDKMSDLRTTLHTQLIEQQEREEKEKAKTKTEKDSHEP